MAPLWASDPHLLLEAGVRKGWRHNVSRMCNADAGAPQGGAPRSQGAGSGLESSRSGPNPRCSSLQLSDLARVASPLRAPSSSPANCQLFGGAFPDPFVPSLLSSAPSLPPSTDHRSVTWFVSLRCCLPPAARRTLHESRGFCLLCSLLRLQDLALNEHPAKACPGKGGRPSGCRMQRSP